MIKMHAKWVFLIKTEELEEVDITNFEDFWVDFYHNNNLDDDNWFLPITIIHDTGEVVPLCEEGAYRDTDWMWRELQQIPIEDRFEWTLNFAAAAIARDFGVDITTVNDERNPIDNYLLLSRENLFRRIEYKIGNRLEALLNLNRGLVSPRPLEEDVNVIYEWDRLYDSYYITEFLNLYLQWANAKEYDRKFRMFGDNRDINRGYRAIQIDNAGCLLEENDEASPLSLIVIDYHY